MKRNNKGILTPHHNLSDLLKNIPQLTKLANISVINITNVDSSDLHPLIWTKISQSIFDNVQKFDGFIIVHGTDTMAYTASALSFALHNINKPIILTGAQKPFDDIPSDATNNLINAIIVASMSKIGTYVVFGSKILQGNRATKMSESDMDAFDSPMVDNTGNIALRPEILFPFKSRNLKKMPENFEFDPNIVVVKITPGITENLEESFIDKYHGLILEGFGPGNLPHSIQPLLVSADKKQIPVVVLSQCRKGVTKMRLYEVGQQVLDGGAIPGEDMTVEAASTKLMWILAKTRDLSKIKRLFLTDIAGEITL